jgi:hypothetical protein
VTPIRIQTTDRAIAIATDLPHQPDGGNKDGSTDVESIWNEFGVLSQHFRGPSEKSIEERVREVCSPS